MAQTALITDNTPADNPAEVTAGVLQASGVYDGATIIVEASASDSGTPPMRPIGSIDQHGDQIRNIAFNGPMHVQGYVVNPGPATSLSLTLVTA